MRSVLCFCSVLQPSVCAWAAGRGLPWAVPGRGTGSSGGETSEGPVEQQSCEGEQTWETPMG